MALDWLYGPRTFQIGPPEAPDLISGYDPSAFRPVVLDTDDIRDIGDFIERQLSTVNAEDVETHFYVQDPIRGGETQDVAADKLADLTLVDKSRIQIETTFTIPQSMSSSVAVTLRRGIQPRVMVGANPETLDDMARIRTEVVHKILDGRKPIPQWTRLAPTAAYIPWVALAASMIAIQATNPGVALSIFGWILTSFALVGTYLISRKIREMVKGKTTGCRVLAETRDARTTRQSDQRTKVKTTFLVAPIGVLVGVGIGVGLALLGLRG